MEVSTNLKPTIKETFCKNASNPLKPRFKMPLPGSLLSLPWHTQSSLWCLPSFPLICACISLWEGWEEEREGGERRAWKGESSRPAGSVHTPCEPCFPSQPLGEIKRFRCLDHTARDSDLTSLERGLDMRVYKSSGWFCSAAMFVNHCH